MMNMFIHNLNVYFNVLVSRVSLVGRSMWTEARGGPAFLFLRCVEVFKYNMPIKGGVNLLIFSLFYFFPCVVK